MTSLFSGIFLYYNEKHSGVQVFFDLFPMNTGCSSEIAAVTPAIFLRENGSLLK